MKTYRASGSIVHAQMRVTAEEVCCWPNRPVGEWWVFRRGQTAWCGGQAAVVLRADTVHGIQGRWTGIREEGP